MSNLISCFVTTMYLLPTLNNNNLKYLSRDKIRENGHWNYIIL